MDVWEFVMNGDETIEILDYLGNPADAKGQFTTFNPPKITRTFDDELRIGERGVNQRPLSIEALESSLTLKGVSTTLCDYINTAFATNNYISILLSGKARSRYNPAATANMAVTVKGHPSSLVTPMFVAGEQAEFEVDIAANYYALSVSTFSMILDLDLGKFEINGVDQWV